MSTTKLETEEKTGANNRNILYEFAKEIFQADSEWLKKMCREERKAREVKDRSIHA